MPRAPRRYRPVVLHLFKHGSVTLKCGPAAQKRVRRMIIQEKYEYEQESDSLLPSAYKMTVTATETTLSFSLNKRFTAARFIFESMTPQIEQSNSEQEDTSFLDEEFT
jgi:hypothetical protein